MAELISREEIDAAAQAVGGDDALKLVQSLVSAIQSAAGDSEVVSMSIESGVVHDAFEAAFEPGAAAASAGQHLRVTVAKVGR